MLYETLHGRMLLVDLPYHKGPAALEAWAGRVAGGHRPPIDPRFPPTLHDLISRCWHQVDHRLPPHPPLWLPTPQADQQLQALALAAHPPSGGRRQAERQTLVALADRQTVLAGRQAVGCAGTLAGWQALEGWDVAGVKALSCTVGLGCLPALFQGRELHRWPDRALKVGSLAVQQVLLCIAQMP